MTSSCSTEVLKSALAGNLSQCDEVLLHRHLEACEECNAALERMAGGASWCQEAAAMLADDELDGALTAGEYSEEDFAVEFLEPANGPDMLGRLGGYEVSKIIGRGGMGVVLKGFDPDLKRSVAIKVLSPHLACSSLAKKRFAREAQAAAAVVHPNVMAIYQVQASGRLPFLVMPLVGGESLAQRLAAKGTLELTEILRIGRQAAAGLAAAHEQGLVHRDVKPANILLEKGVERALLTDFGLACAADDVALTRWGIIAGTPQYMSPEQARGEPLDSRSDLFSLGCILYEMATGVSPFRAASTIATLRRVLDDAPQPMASLNPELPPWFCAVVERLLQKDPAHRINSAQEVSDLLEQCLAHLQQPAVAPLPASLLPQTTGRLRNFNSFRKGVLAVVATLGVALLGMFLGQAPEPAGPTSFALPNGLRVRLVPERDPGKVSLLLAVRAGTLNEGKGQAQLARITGFSTVSDLGDAQLAEKVKQWLAKDMVNAEMLGEFMYFDLDCAPDELPAALAIEAARLGQMNYAAATLEREISNALKEVEYLSRQPDAMGKLALVPFVQAAFHAQTEVPLLRQTKKIGIDDVRSFHDRWFRVDSAVLVVVGDFDVAQTRKAIEDRFGPLAKPKDPLPLRPGLTPGKRRVQWDLPKRHWFISWPLPQADIPDYAALHLVAGVLQQRLFNSPDRAALGTLPEVHDDFDRLLVIGCAAPTEESFEAWRKLVVAEVDRLGQPGGIDEMELRSYCDELDEFFQSDLDKEPLPPDITRTLARGNIELQRLRMEIVAGDFEQLLKRMKAVSPEAAAAAARKWLAADRACIVEVVPEDTKVGAEDQRGARQDGKVVRLVWFPRYSPDGRWLATAHGHWDANEGGEVRAWDALTGEPKFVIPTERGVRTVAWAPKGAFFVSGDYGGMIHFYDGQSGERTDEIKLPRNVEVLQFLPDEERLVAAVGDGSVHVFGLPSKEPLHTWKRLHRKVWGMAISPDGKTLCTGGQDHVAHLIDMDNYEILHRLEHPTDVNGVVFTEDGKHVLTGCGDALIRVFNVESGKEVGRLEGHKQGSVTDLCFAPGGKLLASCGMDGTVRLWDFADFANPKLAETLDGANDVVFGVAISPDGKRLAFGGWSDQIRVIALDTHEVKWSWPQQEQAKDKKPDPDAAADAGDKLRQELLDRQEKDQVARKAAMRQKPGEAELMKMAAVDRENTAWLKVVIDERGWPGKALVGEDGAHAAWLLVQHADLDLAFQKKCLGLLSAAVKKHDASAQDMAYLIDRVRLAEKKPQVYGTQLDLLDGALKPKPIEDEEHVDERRKEVGLAPLSEYLKFAGHAFSQTKDEP